MSTTFKERWEELDPRHKQKIMLGLTLGGVLVIGAMILGVTESSNQTIVAERIENSLLPDGSARELGVSGIGRAVDDLTLRIRQQDEQMAELRRQLEERASPAGAASSDARLHAELVDLRTKLSALEQKSREQAGGGDATRTPPGAPQANGPQGAPPQGAQPRANPTATTVAAPGNSEAAYGQIRTVDSAPSAEATKVSNATPQARRLPPMYIPAGSIIQAVLLSGVDAPSGEGATSDPVPMLARVKHDLILPSRYRSSMRECFLLLEGYGELSSERVQARTNVMSCITHAKEVIEVPLQGYAVGDDGKSGIRGKVMSKQGRALGLAFLAGIADGAAQAIGGNRTNSALAGVGAEVDVSRIGPGAAAGGASGALDRIAAFYLKRADSLFPVVTVEATRKITVVLLKGAEIAPLGPSKK